MRDNNRPSASTNPRVEVDPTSSNNRRERTTVRVDFKPPFEWAAMLNFFRVRAIAGLEYVSDDSYFRTIRIAGEPGILQVKRAAKCDALIATLNSEARPDEVSFVAHLRKMFDLDADVLAICAHLSRDPFLAPLVASRPALRVPAHWEPFETAIRAILGQQVSVAAARRLNARLIERAGCAISDKSDSQPYRLFPTPEQVLRADLSEMGMPGARVRTLQATAEATLANPKLFLRGDTVEQTVERLCAIKGIGPWTAQYIAIRACREPDAFPASDAGLLRGAADVKGKRPSPEDLARRAEKWRPFRAYAAHHIWAHDEANVISRR